MANSTTGLALHFHKPSFTGLYLQVCSYRTIFKISCYKYCQKYFAYSRHSFVLIRKNKQAKSFKALYVQTCKHRPVKFEFATGGLQVGPKAYTSPDLFPEASLHLWRNMA